MKKFLFSTLLALSTMTTLQAQENWTLKRCIDQALQNNIQVKQSELNVLTNEQQLLQSKAGRLPTLNGSASHGYNWGQRIDPFTNRFATDRVQSNNFGLSSRFTLFSGMSQVNTTKQQAFETEASRKDVDAMRNNIALNVARGYLNILFSLELVENAEQQKEITRLQLERMQKLVDAGQVPRGNLLDIESQMARDEQSLVVQQGNLQIAYLNLAQLLMLEPSEAQNFSIARPSIGNVNASGISVSAEEVFQAALKQMPEVQASELRILSADRSVAVANGSRIPSISVTGSYGTGFSGASQRVSGAPFLVGIDTIGATAISAEPVVQPSFGANFEQTPFFDQLRDNVNTNLGVSLSIPIFNGFQTKTGIQRAKIAHQNAKLNLEATHNTLRTSIYQAHTDAITALNRYQAAQKAVTAAQEAFKYAKVRFEQSMINSVDFNNSKNQLAAAESELIQSKYDYLFKVKILDFFQGKSLTF